MLAQDAHTMKDAELSPSGAVSPALAAKLVGCHRTTIVRAIEAGDLKATRRNNLHWSIMISDLEAWHGSSVTRAAPGPEQRQLQRIEDLEELLKGAETRLAAAREDLQATRDREDGLRDLVEVERGRVAQLTADLERVNEERDRLGREREAAVAGQASALATVERLSIQVERQAREFEVQGVRSAEREAALRAEVEAERLAREEAAKVAKERAAELRRLKQRKWWERLLDR